jgi:hypothetical protein
LKLPLSLKGNASRWTQYEKLRASRGLLRLDDARGHSLTVVRPKVELTTLGERLVTHCA